jgi:hypothetical protein
VIPVDVRAFRFQCRQIQTIKLLTDQKTWRYRVSKNELAATPEFNVYEVSCTSAQLGRVIHDPRGNAIWDWTIETAVLAQATVDELLGKLVDPMVLGLERDVERSTRWSGDPYNRSC